MGEVSARHVCTHCVSCLVREWVGVGVGVRSRGPCVLLQSLVGAKLSGIAQNEHECERSEQSDDDEKRRKTDTMKGHLSLLQDNHG